MVKDDWRLASETLGPLLGHPIVLLSIGQILVGYGAHKGVVRIAIGQERADGKQNFTDRECWTPVIL